MVLGGVGRKIICADIGKVWPATLRCVGRKVKHCKYELSSKSIM